MLWHVNPFQKRKERESNPQDRLPARPLSRRLPSPIGLPFQAVKRVRFELTSSAFRRRRIGQLSYLLIGPEGVEPSSGRYKRPALAVELRAAHGIDSPDRKQVRGFLKSSSSSAKRHLLSQ